MLWNYLGSGQCQISGNFSVSTIDYNELDTENVDMVWKGERKERISYRARTPNSSAYSCGLDEMKIFLKPENSS